MTKDDWIEDAKDLLKGVREWHSDPVNSDYNQCDKDLCQWCEQAQKLIDGTPAAPEKWRMVQAPAAFVGSMGVSWDIYEGEQRIAFDLMSEEARPIVQRHNQIVEGK